MEFRDSPEQAAWRKKVRNFLQTELPEEIRGKGGLFAKLERVGAWEQWRKALAERGWVAPAWPKEYGGAGMDVMDQFILNEEFAQARAPMIGGLGTMMLGPTLIAHGTEEQKSYHLPRILAGEENWCQGYSEPGAGSDLASLQTRAVKDGDDFVINGQKIWTSTAHFADWCFLLARTDPDAPKHRGITYLLVDMKSPGITVQPLVNLTGSHEFNEVFFEDVRVPANNVVGEVNRGWYIGATTLDFERSSIGTAVGNQQQIEDFTAWLRDHRTEMGEARYGSLRREWADRALEVHVATLLAYRIISMQAAGQIPNAEASIAKLFGSELAQRIAGTAMHTLGMHGAIRESSAPFAGNVPQSYLGGVSQTIAGGTSEIQRNIIATRGLGLPRG
jgi:alkylation response protein AidB-like acyl-CoA dehydrogenase